MYDNDEYGHGNYGSYYGSRGNNPSGRWQPDYEHESHGVNLPNQQQDLHERYRYHHGRHDQNRGGQYGSGYRHGNDRDRDRNQPDYGRNMGYHGAPYRGNPDDEPWPHYHDNDGYAHGRPYVSEDRGWLDRTADELRSWFGDDQAELRRRMDRYDEDAYPRDYYGRRFRWERWRENEEHLRAATPYYGPPYGPNVGSDF